MALITPIGFRVGYNRIWSTRVPSVPLQSELIWVERYIKEFVEWYFMRKRMIRLSFILSNVAVVFLSSRRIGVTVFVYDGFMEDLYARISSKWRDRYSRELRRKDRGIIWRRPAVVKPKPKYKRRKRAICRVYLSDSSLARASVSAASAISVSVIRHTLRFEKLMRVKARRKLVRKRRRRNSSVLWTNPIVNLFHSFYLRRMSFRAYKLVALTLRFLLKQFLPFEVTVRLKPVSSYRVTASVLARFIRIKLRSRYSIGELMGSVLSGMRFYKYGIGICACARGRFTRKQRASAVAYRKGNVPLNSVSVPVDYTLQSVPLKYGACGIRIYIAK